MDDNEYFVEQVEALQRVAGKQGLISTSAFIDRRI
jgi:hypothetical protein